MGWCEAFKDIATVADPLMDAELKQKLADVQLECAKLVEENSQLRQELVELHEQVNTRQEMRFQKNVYWLQIGQEKSEGPFCPKCLDGKNKTARMSERSDDMFWRCSVCGYASKKTGYTSGLSGRAEIDFDPLAD